MRRWLRDPAAQALIAFLGGWFGITAGLARTWRGWALGIGVLLVIEAFLLLGSAIRARKERA